MRAKDFICITDTHTRIKYDPNPI